MSRFSQASGGIASRDSAIFLADMAEGTVKGRAAGTGAGPPQDLTGSQLVAIASARTQGKTTIWVPAELMVPAAPLTITQTTFAGNPQFRVAEFDSASPEFVHWALALPKSWNEGTLSAQFFWTHKATATNFGVRWNIYAQAMGDNEAIGSSYNTVAVSDTGGTTDNLYISPETGALTPLNSPQEGDMLAMAVGRDTAHGDDTLAIDALLIGVKLFFTTNAGNDA